MFLRRHPGLTCQHHFFYVFFLSGITRGGARPYLQFFPFLIYPFFACLFGHPHFFISPTFLSFFVKSIPHFHSTPTHCGFFPLGVGRLHSQSSLSRWQDPGPLPIHYYFFLAGLIFLKPPSVLAVILPVLRISFPTLPFIRLSPSRYLVLHPSL